MQRCLILAGPMGMFRITRLFVWIGHSMEMFQGLSIIVPVQVETSDRHYYHMALFTTRKVDAMEELTWDYGIDFEDEDHHLRAFPCSCGNNFCRNMKRASRSRTLSNAC